jgi:hypothetical protein
LLSVTTFDVTDGEAAANLHGQTDVTDVTDRTPERQLAPLLGDELYPLMLAEAGRNGHITEDEFTELYALHKAVEAARR